MMARWFLVGALLCCAVLLAAGCDSGRRPRAQMPVAQVPVAPPVTQSVGAGGGIVNGPGGFVLNVPPGALAATTTITISIDPAPPALPAGFASASQAFTLTPHGTTFSVPVTVTVPFDPAQFSAGETPMLIKTIGQDDGWQQLVARRTGATLTAAAAGFSTFVVPRNDNRPIVISRHPRNSLAVDEGTFWAFNAEAISPTPPVRYQWLRSGAELPGETNSGIFLPAVGLADNAHQYSVRATDARGQNAFSNPAILTVVPVAPTIVNHPVDTDTPVDFDAAFAASSTSNIPHTTRWQRSDDDGATDDDATWVDIPGATNVRLTVSSPQQADDGARFRFVATNSRGSTASRSARLTIIAAPTQPAIVAHPQSVNVLRGSHATLQVQATGGALSYSWEGSADNVTFAPIASLITHNSPVVRFDDLQVSDGGRWIRVRVTNPVGVAVSDAALLTVRLPIASGPRRLGGGTFHSVGLHEDGSLRSWGGMPRAVASSTQGLLGDGNAASIDGDAVDVLHIDDALTLAAGALHTLAVRQNGEVWGWGGNRRGQLVPGGPTHFVEPVRIAGIGPARDVAAGRFDFDTEDDPFGASFSLFVLEDGEVWGIGENQRGQLGDGSNDAPAAPVRAGNLAGIVRVAAGEDHSLALRDDGAVWAWGSNDRGQLGNGSTAASLHPIPIAMPARMVDIVASSDRSFALAEDGSVWSWGGHALEPVRMSVPGPDTAIADVDGAVLALRGDGRVFAVGGFDRCGCGEGTGGEAGEAVPRPVLPPLPDNIVAIGAGFRHGLALDEFGNVWAWGSNRYGQVNDGVTHGTEDPVLAPVQVRNVSLSAPPPPPPPPPPTGGVLTVQLRTILTDARVVNLGTAPGEPEGSRISCTINSPPEQCSEAYAAGEVVTLVASPAAQFLSWENCPLVIDVRGCEITMNSDRDVVAVFRQ